MNDSLRYQGLRKQLVEKLIEKGVKDNDVLSAIGKVPRHLMFDGVFHNKFAYEDMAFPIGAGQTISQPYTVAIQTELLRVSKGMKVLEVGTGSGYQTAVLLELGCKVYSIERQRELYLKTKTILPKLGYKGNLYFGDGYKGKAVFGPFEGVIVTCGAPFIPQDLLKQLAVGGRMVVPVGDGKSQKMLLIEKKGDNDFKESYHGEFSFVPMLEDKQY